MTRPTADIVDVLRSMCPVATETDGSEGCCFYHEAATALEAAEAKLGALREASFGLGINGDHYCWCFRPMPEGKHTGECKDMTASLLEDRDANG